MRTGDWRLGWVMIILAGQLWSLLGCARPHRAPLDRGPGMKVTREDCTMPTTPAPQIVAYPHLAAGIHDLEGTLAQLCFAKPLIGGGPNNPVDEKDDPGDGGALTARLRIYPEARAHTFDYQDVAYSKLTGTGRIVALIENTTANKSREFGLPGHGLAVWWVGTDTVAGTQSLAMQSYYLPVTIDATGVPRLSSAIEVRYLTEGPRGVKSDLPLARWKDPTQHGTLGSTWIDCTSGCCYSQP